MTDRLKIHGVLSVREIHFWEVWTFGLQIFQILCKTSGRLQLTSYTLYKNFKIPVKMHRLLLLPHTNTFCDVGTKYSLSASRYFNGNLLQIKYQILPSGKTKNSWQKKRNKGRNISNSFVALITAYTSVTATFVRCETWVCIFEWGKVMGKK